jgi:hypothetical protein
MNMHAAAGETSLKKSGQKKRGEPITTVKEMAAAARAVRERSYYREAAVAEALGLARQRLVTLRVEHMVEGPDYRIDHNEVVLTPEGLMRMYELTAGMVATPAPEQKPATVTEPATPPKPGPPRREKFRVQKIPRNKRLLYCVKADEPLTARMILVRVKDNSFFMPKMTMECIEGELGSWQFKGRLPRRKGRW